VLVNYNRGLTNIPLAIGLTYVLLKLIVKGIKNKRRDYVLGMVFILGYYDCVVV